MKHFAKHRARDDLRDPDLIAEHFYLDEAGYLTRDLPRLGRIMPIHQGRPDTRKGWNSGRNVVRVGGVTLYADEIVVALTYGLWPKEVIHYNGNLLDDRPENLFPLFEENPLPRGVKRSGKKFAAQVWTGKTSAYLGTFDTVQEASEARTRYILQAEKEELEARKANLTPA